MKTSVTVHELRDQRDILIDENIRSIVRLARARGIRFRDLGRALLIEWRRTSRV